MTELYFCALQVYARNKRGPRAARAPNLGPANYVRVSIYPFELNFSYPENIENISVRLKATILLLQIDGLIVTASIEFCAPYFVHGLVLCPTVVN